MTTFATRSTAKGRPLSVVIISKNEAARIEACLQSVSWADEIVVVDSGSTDCTHDIVRRYTDQLHIIDWRGFGPQKQAGVELAAHDWILCVDCDERITPELAEEIQQILGSRPLAGAYCVPRRTFLGDQEIKHCGWYPDLTIRLFDRTQARFCNSSVHEKVLTEAPTARCKGHMLHYSFAGIGDLLAKMNRYTDLSARQMWDEGRTATVLDLTLRPLFAFVKTFVFRAGYLDGVAGLIVSVSSATHVFYKYAKLRELSRPASTPKKGAP